MESVRADIKAELVEIILDIIRKAGVTSTQNIIEEIKGWHPITIREAMAELFPHIPGTTISAHIRNARA